MATYVFSLGGSFLSMPEKASSFLKLVRAWGHKSIIVVGGGNTARSEIELARKLGVKSERELHLVGISATFLNAEVVARVLHCKMWKGDPRRIKPSGKYTVMGGYLPGWTTDIDAAYAAKAGSSKVLFNLSKEKGVYDRNPNVYKDARLLKHMSYKQAIEMQKDARVPGMNFIIDPKCVEICMRSGIKIVVTNEPEDIKAYIEGKKIRGTVIE